MESLLHKGWAFSGFSEAAIASSAEMDALAVSLGTAHIHLPDMTHPGNFLEIRHVPTGFRLRVDAAGALKKWQAEQLAVYGASLGPTAFNWTYDCHYDGDAAFAPAGSYVAALSGETAAGSAGSAPSVVPTSERIPVDKLKRPDPILFYQSFRMYADELHDNGFVESSAKFRVMPTCFLLLVRVYLRLDRERVWMRDVRYYHAFGEPHIIKDVQLRQDAVAELRKVRAERGMRVCVRVRAVAWPCSSNACCSSNAAARSTTELQAIGAPDLPLVAAAVRSPSGKRAAPAARAKPAVLSGVAPRPADGGVAAAAASGEHRKPAASSSSSMTSLAAAYFSDAHDHDAGPGSTSSGTTEAGSSSGIGSMFLTHASATSGTEHAEAPTAPAAPADADGDADDDADATGDSQGEPAVPLQFNVTAEQVYEVLKPSKQANFLVMLAPPIDASGAVGGAGTA